MRRRPQLAVILTEWGSISHGFCVASKLIEGLEFADRTEPPRCDVVALHLMEAGEGETAARAGPDIGRATAAAHGIPMYHSVAAALCRGGDELAVDGVVIVGEHGTWPRDARGRILYPRRELFDQVCGVFRQAGRSVPVFNDKELSWSWPWARHMWRQVRELAIPFMAGSSVPWLPFHPAVPLPCGQALGHVVVVGWGNYDRYAFHALELAQLVLERRGGGETGVARVRCVTDQERIAALDAGGEWPAAERSAAFAAIGLGPASPFDGRAACVAVDVEYLDGHRLTALLVNPGNRSFAFAYRHRGGDQVCAAGAEEDPLPRLAHMSGLVRAIEELMVIGQSVVPAERTLLTTGVLAAGFESHAAGDDWVPTPDLDIAYQPRPLPSAWHDALR